MAGIRFVCQRRAQHEVWLPGRVQHADKNYYYDSTVIQVRTNNGVPNQITENLAYPGWLCRSPRHPGQLLCTGSVDQEH